jgi:hypothetical protein
MTIPKLWSARLIKSGRRVSFCYEVSPYRYELYRLLGDRMHRRVL